MDRKGYCTTLSGHRGLRVFVWEIQHRYLILVVSLPSPTFPYIFIRCVLNRERGMLIVPWRGTIVQNNCHCLPKSLSPRPPPYPYPNVFSCCRRRWIRRAPAAAPAATTTSWSWTCTHTPRCVQHCMKGEERTHTMYLSAAEGRKKGRTEGRKQAGAGGYLLVIFAPIDWLGVAARFVISFPVPSGCGLFSFGLHFFLFIFFVPGPGCYARVDERDANLRRHQ